MIQREVLVDMIRKYSKGKPFKGIEIGTLAGDTVSFITQHCENLKMITVDPDPAASYAETVYPYLDRIQLYKVESDKAVKLIKNKVDFVWIDGNHDYKQVLADIKNYMPLIKDGGFLGGHDYGSPIYAGVKEAVDLMFGKEVTIEADFVWWIDMPYKKKVAKC